MNLDLQQQAAVQTESRSALVIAGAGSGKTRVLTERIGHLIEHAKVSPYEILSFTFTRKAAGEMKARLESRIGPKAHHVTMGTMHAIALQMLRRFGELVGLRPGGITVYSAWEEEFLLKEVARDIGFYKKTWKVPKKDIDRMFADFYQEGKSPSDDHPARDLFLAFMQRCRENNALTYGGLLMGLDLIVSTLAKHLHWRHILVDEIQDIDPLQWKIINALCRAFNASLFVVGDIDQSIYAFRGAVPGYLLEHQGEFDIFLLESNYRSAAPIVDGANRLIAHNTGRIGKTMRAARPKPIVSTEDYDDGIAVGIEVAGEMDSAALSASLKYWPWEDTAVLARNHVLLRRLSEELTAREIPHTYIGRKSALTNSEEFRRFHAFLKLLVNPHDNFSFLLVKDLLGVTPEQYSAIRVDAVINGCGHLMAARSYLVEGGYDEFFRETSLPLVVAFIIGLVFDKFECQATAEFIMSWMESNAAGSIQEYLDWLATYDIQDEITDRDEGLSLMTIHAAKGLEWPVVIVASCNEGILPSKQAAAAGEIEEERRLMYVAMTRARDQLILAVRPERQEKGDGRVYESPMSRFVRETQT